MITKIDVINILGSLQALGFFQDRNIGYFFGIYCLLYLNVKEINDLLSYIDLFSLFPIV